MSNTNQQICSRCVMDATDPLIKFNAAGVCSHCQSFDRGPNTTLRNNNLDMLDEIVKGIISSSNHKKYHCIIGLSGGLDSSYLAYFLRNRYPDLRILAVHVDCGWNSPEAVNNIEVLVRKLNLTYACKVLDWSTVKSLQLAYLKSGVPNQDIPQDYAFYVGVYDYARQHGIKYYLNGGNLASESILPSAWGYDNKDSKQLKSIHKRFGDGSLNKYRIYGYFKTYIFYRLFYRLEKIRPLNYIDYNLNNAKQILEKELGWKDYGGKHHESRFTRFFQAHYLPTYFGYDKRKAHFSSLINVGQMTRAEASSSLKEPLYSAHSLKLDKNYLARKLELSVGDFEKLLLGAKRPHSSLPSWRTRNRILQVAKRYTKKLFGLYLVRLMK